MPARARLSLGLHIARITFAQVSYVSYVSYVIFYEPNYPHLRL